ncbi:MAG: hypothetical protein OHK0057_08600 [Thermoflexibacter sp.]
MIFVILSSLVYDLFYSFLPEIYGFPYTAQKNICVSITQKEKWLDTKKKVIKYIFECKNTNLYKYIEFRE